MLGISLIVAKSANDVIGQNNALPWRIPEDLKLFKKHTLNKPVIMGRKTYESIGRPLPNRLNIVLTRNGFRVPGVSICHSLEEGVELGVNHCRSTDVGEIMIIGGAEIFRLAMSMATRIYLTNIPREFDGDAFFPTDLLEDWEQVHEEKVPTQSEDVDYFDFSILHRKASPQFA